MYSVRDNPETFVPAGNELGKDFVAGLIAIWFFVTRRPAIVLTTSVQSGQLEDVLWGEIRKFIDTSEVRLPIQYNHLQIRQVRSDGSLEPQSKLVGKVVNKGESLLGRHVPRGPGGIPTTLAIFDEASGIDNAAFETSDTWTHRKLVIGNCYPCSNFFYKGVKEGTSISPVTEEIHRKVIRIKAEHSPNVRYALAEIKAGRKVSHKELIPGVVSYLDYMTRRALWDPIRQCIGLDADFHEGSDILMYPPDWLNRAEQIAESIRTSKRVAKAIGVDTAEGGDSSSWSVVDERGLIEQVSKKTPDTSVIPNFTLHLMRAWNVPAEMVCFDTGGGGKQHADFMRSKGHHVDTVAFGASAKAERRRGMKKLQERNLEDETMYAYKNKRAEMFGTLRWLMNPTMNPAGFGIPDKYTELRRQLAPIPLMFDPEGRLMLLPKNKKDPNSKLPTLTELIGCSPDEADSLAIAVYKMRLRKTRRKAGVIS